MLGLGFPSVVFNWLSGLLVEATGGFSASFILAAATCVPPIILMLVYRKNGEKKLPEKTNGLHKGDRFFVALFCFYLSGGVFGVDGFAAEKPDYRGTFEYQYRNDRVKQQPEPLNNRFAYQCRNVDGHPLLTSAVVVG